MILLACLGWEHGCGVVIFFLGKNNPPSRQTPKSDPLVELNSSTQIQL